MQPIFRLPCSLFSRWLLEAVTLIFYGSLGLKYGSMFSPFALTDGLYLAEIFPVPFHSVSQAVCGAKDLVAQTRSVTLDPRVPISSLCSSIRFQWSLPTPFCLMQFPVSFSSFMIFLFQVDWCCFALAAFPSTSWSFL